MPDSTARLNPIEQCAKAGWERTTCVPWSSLCQAQPHAQRTYIERALHLICGVVDPAQTEDPQVLAEALRIGLITPEGKIRIGVCALVVRADGRVLGVTRRGRAKDDLTAYGLPGGKLERGDTPRLALERELREECGVEIVSASFLYEALDDANFFVRTFLVEIQGKPYQPNPAEGHVDWVTWEILEGGPFGAYNKALHGRYLRSVGI